MKQKNSDAKRIDGRPIMVWSITDDVIEHQALREAQFQDLLKAGFGGIAAWIRCSRYSWDDPQAMNACRQIIGLCRKNGMTCWLGPDPRFVSHKLTDDGSGLELLLFGNAGRADIVPNISPVHDGRYSVRCGLTPRHVHTLTDVAVEFTPIQLAGVFAVRQGSTPLAKGDVVDVTMTSRMFYNARDRYVEAFGVMPPRFNDAWSVVAFFHVRTNHMDFSNRLHLQRYDIMLNLLKLSGCSPDGIMWDEPGYTCMYGSLPYSSTIREMYQAERQRPLGHEMWKLAFESSDRSEIPVRLAYYRVAQETIHAAESRLKKTVRKLWGPQTIVGIHDTWHFESADMCDMNHGSMDLWHTADAKSAGFVDLGGIQALKDPASPHYTNLAAMSVIVSSLGKMTPEKAAYNNLWTVGDDDGQGWQRDAMEHCVRIMGLFGTRWLAHAYGPVGTIGQERTFLGSPPLPGYPEHSTWPLFPGWNSMLNTVLMKLGGALPQSNLLVVYPVETMYALADQRADKVAADIFALILNLLDNRFHVDVRSTSSLKRASWKDDRLHVGSEEYDFVLAPYPDILERATLRLLTKVAARSAFVFTTPARLHDGSKAGLAGMKSVSAPDDIFGQLMTIPELRPVSAPENCWVTMTPVEGGTIVSLAPSRAGYTFGGEVSFSGETIIIEESEQLRQIRFPTTGSPQLL